MKKEDKTETIETLSLDDTPLLTDDTVEMLDFEADKKVSNEIDEMLDFIDLSDNKETKKDEQNLDDLLKNVNKDTNNNVLLLESHDSSDLFDPPNFLVTFIIVFVTGTIIFLSIKRAILLKIPGFLFISSTFFRSI